MKNICIRDKFNREIPEDIRNELHKLEFNRIDFNDLYKDHNLVRESFYKLKFVFDFKQEEEDFLREIKYVIDKFDSAKLIYLCDSYEYRFFNIYDYILSNIVIDFENFNNIISVFLDLLKKGKTKNSLNLSIFILGCFENNVILNFCRDFLLNDLDCLEVCGFLLRNHEMNNEITYFSLFKCLYLRNFKIIDLIYRLNENYFNSYLKIIISFYLFEIKDFNVSILKDFELKVFIKYMTNYKKSVDKISGRFLFSNNLEEFKFMLTDFNFVLKKLEKKINMKGYDGNLDIELFYLGINLFEKFGEYFSNIKFRKNIYLKFLENLYNRNYRECKRIVLIYNILDINISDKMKKIFNEEYDSIDFLKFILRVFRDYKYFHNILIEFEKNVYLTKLIDDFEFRNLFLRSLVIVYDKFDFEIAGIGFLKIIMSYEEFYNELSPYINFIVQKNLERS